MKKRNRMLLMVVLVFAVVLNMATGVLATEQEHDHNWVLQGGGPRGHSFRCDGCGQYKSEDHTVDSSGNCTVCSYHIHIWQRAWSDNQFHCMVCSGCQEKKTVTHSKDSAGVCTICGHIPHEHIWQYTQGENYAYNHGLHCTQCAATSSEDHIYGNDGNCIVCGNAPPHEHQWEWDGNKSNYLGIHFMVCSCGERTSEPHQLFAWNGQIGNDRGHSALCGVCGFALVFEHVYDSAYFNGQRCTVCGYPGQGTTVPGTKPSETTPVETRPAESKPNETAPVETRPAESKPKETTPVETETAETQAKEMECTESESTQSEPPSSETTNQNSEEKDSRHSSSIWVWVAVILAAVGGLGAVVLFLKKKSY